MADETRTVIIDVEVETRDFDKEIGEVNSALVENNKQISELKKNYSENATEIARLEASNRSLSKAKSQLIKESQTEANSLDALRLKLAKLTAERNATNTSTAEGAARFEELQVSIKNTSDAISGFEQQGGDFRRNVGNYPELLDKATGGFLTLFRTLLANPIGIIISALAGLVAIFAKTQTGAEFFRKAGALLNTTMAKLKDVVEFLGAALISAFENPKQAITDLIDVIQNGVVKYFTEFIPNAIKTTLNGFLLLGKAIKQVFSGDFEQAQQTALDLLISFILASD